MAYPNLRAEMTRKGLTQSDLATFLGCRLATINSWMQGQESGFPMKKVSAIQKQFFPGCSIEYLFDESGTRGDV